LQIARSADSGIVHVLYAGVVTVPNNLRSEIDFVMWRSNAWTELDDEIRRIRSEMSCQRGDGFGHNCELGSLLTGVHQPDTAPDWIEKINRAAIGDVNAKRYAALIGNQAIASVETLFGLNGGIDHCDAIAMYLLRGKKGRMFET